MVRTRKAVANSTSLPPVKSTRLRIPQKILNQLGGLPEQESNPIFSLPAEILDQVFYSLDYGERWCFALSCKAAARYAGGNETFLQITSVASTQTLAHHCPSLGSRPGRIYSWRCRDKLSDSEAHSEIMRTLSIGWVDKATHWCDHCSRFKAFPAQTRTEWYGGCELRPTVEAMRKGGGWVQDIGLSVDGLICWNHSCPTCSQRWWQGLPANNGKNTEGKQVTESKRGG